MKKRVKVRKPTVQAKIRKTRKTRLRRLVGRALRDVSVELETHRPKTWPDTPDDERVASRAANDAIDAVQRSLDAVADNLTKRRAP